MAALGLWRRVGGQAASSRLRAGHTSPPCAVSRPSKRLVVTVNASEGVQDLLSRDRKKAPLVPELDDDTPIERVLDQSEDPAQVATSSRAAVPRPKSRSRRRQEMAEAAAAAEAESSKDAGPRSCKEAIDQGLALFADKQYQAAIDMFNLALELPGNGAYRLPGSPREYSCPSDAEEHAALYNMACCYAQLGQVPAALTCVEAVLETGFEDVKTLRSDPDLQPAQGAQLEALINKYTGVGGMLGKLFTQKEKVIVSDDNKNKPWIIW